MFMTGYVPVMHINQIFEKAKIFSQFQHLSVVSLLTHDDPNLAVTVVSDLILSSRSELIKTLYPILYTYMCS